MKDVLITMLPFCLLFFSSAYNFKSIFSLKFSITNRQFIPTSSRILINTLENTVKRKDRGTRSLQCRILKLSKRKASIIAPARVSTEQWQAYWGMNPMERLQRVMECALFAYGGAWLAWFTSFMAGSLVAAIIGTLTIFNWMYNPWIYAKKRNAKLWPSSRRLHFGIFSARIKTLTRIKRKSANTIGGVSPEFLELVLEDEQGRKLDILTQWQDSYSNLRISMLTEALICSPDSGFRQITMVSELWVPSSDVWVGDYPYLNRPAFRSLISQTTRKKEREKDETIRIMEESRERVGDERERIRNREKDEEKREWDIPIKDDSDVIRRRERK